MEENVVKFTLEQIEELKYIIEDAGTNDAIDYIDEVVASQNVKGYKVGRVVE